MLWGLGRDGTMALSTKGNATKASIEDGEKTQNQGDGLQVQRVSLSPHFD